ncbi:hypothetical protein I3843_01G178000 [Carya illinoinensis]|nr:hypothetical protein I3843_01G178000 [Carya illinoinensis]
MELNGATQLFFLWHRIRSTRVALMGGNHSISKFCTSWVSSASSSAKMPEDRIFQIQIALAINGLPDKSSSWEPF